MCMVYTKRVASPNVREYHVKILSRYQMDFQRCDVAIWCCCTIANTASNCSVIGERLATMANGLAIVLSVQVSQLLHFVLFCDK